jgi:hypothetical protein
VTARHVFISRSNTGWMEIYHGTRATSTAAATPMTIQPLTPATGVTLTNGNTRRVGFKTANDSSLATYPGVSNAAYNYHQDNMPGFTGYTRLDTGSRVFEDSGAVGVSSVDPYYTG